jgi:hypothetical protein
MTSMSKVDRDIQRICGLSSLDAANKDYGGDDQCNLREPARDNTQ